MEITTSHFKIIEDLLPIQHGNTVPTASLLSTSPAGDWPQGRKSRESNGYRNNGMCLLVLATSGMKRRIGTMQECPERILARSGSASSHSAKSAAAAGSA